MTMIIETKEDFDRHLSTADRPVLLFFNAAGCPHSTFMASRISEFSQNHPDIEIMAVDIRDHVPLRDRFGVFSIPRIRIAIDGQVLARQLSGRRTQKELEDFINDTLGASFKPVP